MFNAADDGQAAIVFVTIAIIFVLAVPITLIAMYIDPRKLSGDPIWAKPFKFALSLAVHFATFALITTAMPRAMQEMTGLKGAAFISAFAGLSELTYIAAQAARGRHSHFNFATRIEKIMSMLMGVGAVLVLVPGFVIGAIVLIGPLTAWSWPIRLGVGIGMLGGASLTLLTGLAMGAVRSRFPKSSPPTSAKMWLTGWSLTGADLRPSHFLAAHMMQSVPMAAVLATMCLQDQMGLIATFVFGVAWGALTLQTYRSALAGHALPHLFHAIARAQTR